MNTLEHHFKAFTEYIKPGSDLDATLNEAFDKAVFVIYGNTGVGKSGSLRSTLFHELAHFYAIEAKYHSEAKQCCTSKSIYRSRYSDPLYPTNFLINHNNALESFNTPTVAVNKQTQYPCLRPSKENLHLVEAFLLTQECNPVSSSSEVKFLLHVQEPLPHYLDEWFIKDKVRRAYLKLIRDLKAIIRRLLATRLIDTFVYIPRIIVMIRRYSFHEAQHADEDCASMYLRSKFNFIFSKVELGMFYFPSLA